MHAACKALTKGGSTCKVSENLRTRYFKAWRELRKCMEKCSGSNGQVRKVGLDWTYEELAEEMILWLLKTIGQQCWPNKYKKQVPWIKVLHMLPQRYAQRMEVDFPLRQVYTDDFVVYGGETAKKYDKKGTAKKYPHYSEYNGIVARLLQEPNFESFLRAFHDAGITNPANPDDLVPEKFDAEACHPKPVLIARDLVRHNPTPAGAAATASAEDLEEQVDVLTDELRPLLRQLVLGQDNIASIVRFLKDLLPTDPRPLSRTSSAESDPSGAVLVLESKTETC